MIRATNVTKRFGRVAAVDGVNLIVHPGESIALWGGNGAGKTTLIRCMLGVLRFRGAISIAGIDVRRRGTRARRLIGYVPQELSFHDDMRLGAAMGFYAALRGVRAQRGRMLLDRFGLAGHERKRLRDLSGGMKQRLALSVALLADPPIVVLDEPTSNLDAHARNEVIEALRDLRRDGRTIILASHRRDEVGAIADRVIVLERGRVRTNLPPADLWHDTLHVLRLYVEGSERGAYSLLRDAGFTAELNGHGLCVSVQADQKAAPILTLSGRGVRVRNFEILEGENAR